MRFTSVLCLACLGSPNGCEHRNEEPWIPTEEELALEPHPASSEMQPQDAKPDNQEAIAGGGQSPRKGVTS